MEEFGAHGGGFHGGEEDFATGVLGRPAQTRAGCGRGMKRVRLRIGLRLLASRKARATLSLAMSVAARSECWESLCGTGSLWQELAEGDVAAVIQNASERWFGRIFVEWRYRTSMRDGGKWPCGHVGGDGRVYHGAR